MCDQLITPVWLAQNNFVHYQKSIVYKVALRTFDTQFSSLHKILQEIVYHQRNLFSNFTFSCEVRTPMFGLR